MHEQSITVERDGKYFIESGVERGKVLEGPFSSQREADRRAQARSDEFGRKQMPGPYDMQMGGLGPDWLQQMAPMVLNNPQGVAETAAMRGQPAPPPLPQAPMPILPTQAPGGPGGYVPLEQQTPEFPNQLPTEAQPQLSPGQAGLGASRMLGAASGVMAPGFQPMPAAGPVNVPVHAGSGVAANPALNQALMQMLAPRQGGNALGPLILGGGR